MYICIKTVFISFYFKHSRNILSFRCFCFSILLDNLLKKKKNLEPEFCFNTKANVKEKFYYKQGRVTEYKFHHWRSTVWLPQQNKMYNDSLTCMELGILKTQD
jgi:hypothetical protein